MGFRGPGKALKWQAYSWAGPKGPLSNVGLLVELLGLLYPMGDRARWIRAPAHMVFEGYEIANNLAVAGMCQSTLWEVVSGRVVRPPLVGLVRAPNRTLCRSQVNPDAPFSLLNDRKAVIAWSSGPPLHRRCSGGVSFVCLGCPANACTLTARRMRCPRLGAGQGTRLRPAGCWVLPIVIQCLPPGFLRGHAFLSHFLGGVCHSRCRMAASRSPHRIW